MSDGFIKTKKLNINVITSLFTVVVIVITAIFISFFSYREYQENLDFRVLEHLKSIKRLKRLQIEDFLNSKLKETNKLSKIDSIEVNGMKYVVNFKSSQLNWQQTPHRLSDGLYDFTQYNKSKELFLVKINFINNESIQIEQIQSEKIGFILLENTGMGLSGESYIVGHDYRMRSKSRFLKDKKPYDIIVKTEGSINALNQKSNAVIIKDYRNILVYSSFHALKISHINWAILAEIDVDEIQKPLIDLKIRLFVIALIIILIISISFFFLSKKISVPIINLSKYLKNISDGNYTNHLPNKSVSSEVTEAYQALQKLQVSLKSSVEFAKKIGEMDLNTNITPLNETDTLRMALQNMKEKLKEFKETENYLVTESKKTFIRGEEKERSRISKELHDGLGPMLTTLKMMIQSSGIEENKKEEMKQTTDQIIEEVRLFSYTLLPQSLSDFGVSKALENWIFKLKKITPIAINYSESLNIDPKELASDLQICIYRVIQELVNNSIKHSQASKIVIDISNSEEEIIISFYDDGVGFSQQTEQMGIGLLNIKERISILNGKIEINSSTLGTKIFIELPNKSQHD
jgi:signal transduction histidine kinase